MALLGMLPRLNSPWQSTGGIELVHQTTKHPGKPASPVAEGAVAQGELNPMPQRVPKQLAAVDRCGARTRAGRPCQQPQVTGRRRCRLHGGAPGSGAPTGKRNGRYQNGHYTKEAKAERQWIRSLLHLAKETP